MNSVSRTTRSRIASAVATLFVGLGMTQPAFSDSVGGAPAKLGQVHFKVECNAAAQKEFDLAMAYYHSFAWELYTAPLDRALQADPSCGMAHWLRALGEHLGRQPNRPREGVVEHAEGPHPVRHAAAGVGLQGAVERRRVGLPEDFFVVLVTAPDLKTARALAKAALQARLLACANLVPRVESHYWWQGKIESGNEVLMILKTTRKRLAALEKLILSKHPYDTAEFLVLPLHAGTNRYLDWLAQSCEPQCKVRL